MLNTFVYECEKRWKVLQTKRDKWYGERSKRELVIAIKAEQKKRLGRESEKKRERDRERQKEREYVCE